MKHKNYKLKSRNKKALKMDLIFEVLIANFYDYVIKNKTIK